ncbi:MAG: hypothetical protein ACI4T1_02285 [Christensenellales bacterium]
MEQLICGVTLLETILKTEFLTSILLGAVGFAIICLAKRITKTIRKTNFVANDDKAYIVITLIGLLLVLIAFVVLLFASL